MDESQSTEKELIYLELKHSTTCSLAILVKNSQATIVKAIEDLRGMLEDKSKRPEHLKDEKEITEHLNLHFVLLEDCELIIGEIEQALLEHEADTKAGPEKPFWMKA